MSLEATLLGLYNKYGIGDDAAIAITDTMRALVAAGKVPYEARFANLEALAYVPGLWRCARCKFNMMRTTLNVATGAMSADNTTGDKCPNCSSPLWRVTERDAGKEAIASYMEAADRIDVISKALKGCIAAMEMQQSRDAGEFHVPQPTAKKIWDEALNEAKRVVKS